MTAKDTKGKAKLGLIPLFSKEQVAFVREYGCRKYNDEVGDSYFDVSIGDFLDAAERHIGKYRTGRTVDEESGLSHLAHAATSLLLAVDIAGYTGEYMPSLVEADKANLDIQKAQEELNVYFDTVKTQQEKFDEKCCSVNEPCEECLEDMAHIRKGIDNIERGEVLTSVYDNDKEDWLMTDKDGFQSWLFSDEPVSHCDIECGNDSVCLEKCLSDRQEQLWADGDDNTCVS